MLNPAILSKPPRTFSFAGFDFPKFVWTLPRGSIADRLARAKKPRYVGEYSCAPDPNRKDRGIGFYLDSVGMPNLRWQWCDKIDDSPISHGGWYSDENDGTVVRGIVFRLPKSRGFLAGWSMGEAMSSVVDCCIYDDMRDAIYAADSMAQRVAEDERDYQAREDERLRLQELIEEKETELCDARRAYREAVNVFLAARESVASRRLRAMVHARSLMVQARERTAEIIADIRNARIALESIGE